MSTYDLDTLSSLGGQGSLPLRGDLSCDWKRTGGSWVKSRCGEGEWGTGMFQVEETFAQSL